MTIDLIAPRSLVTLTRAVQEMVWAKASGNMFEGKNREGLQLGG